MSDSDAILDSRLKLSSGILIDAVFDLIIRDDKSEGSETDNVYRRGGRVSSGYAQLFLNPQFRHKLEYNRVFPKYGVSYSLTVTFIVEWSHTGHLSPSDIERLFLLMMFHRLILNVMNCTEPSLSRNIVHRSLFFSG